MSEKKIQRQAVVIIHGMGEQQPMGTIRGFVEDLLPDPKNSYQEKYYVKPDELSESFELRRITYPEGRGLPKTDFFEYYWAHQMNDTKISDTFEWLKDILLHYKYVPKRLKPVYFSIVGSILLAIGLFVVGYIYNDPIKGYLLENPFIKLILSAGLILIIRAVWNWSLTKMNFLFINVFGDVPRYIKPKPRNITKRQSIRTEGLKLLRGLHGEGREDSRPYDRIVIVGHSLGSIIAYDLISILWSSYHSKFKTFPAEYQYKLKEIEKQVAEMLKKEALTDEEIEEFQKLQNEFLEVSKSAGCPWLISDFLTIGSPLAHGQMLMAEGKEGLKKFQRERIYPTCPPTLELQKKFSYNRNLKGEDGKPFNVTHHAALFAMTRWTNIWFANDYFAGPMNEPFGKGIKDIPLKSLTKCIIPFTSHSVYWKKGETESLGHIKKVIFPSHSTAKNTATPPSEE